MAEVHRSVVNFFCSQLGSGTALGKAGAGQEWVADKVIAEFAQALLKRGNRLQLKNAGRAFAEVVLSDMNAKYDYDSVQDAISLLPKVFTHYLRGDGAGIWKTDSISPGYVCLRENIPFDCFFTEGLLVGLLQRLGAAGAVVHHKDCREEDPKAKFCVYDLKWMRSNLSGRPSAPETKKPRA